MLTMSRFALSQSHALPSLRMLFVVWSCVALPWVVTWFALADLGGWPLNDDPFYAKPLALWVAHGEWQWVRQYGALTASSVAHVLTGALVVSENSVEYRWLFLVCIAQLSLGAAAMFLAARALDVAAPIAWLAAFTLATFPLVFGHAFTFMTDGPATAWAAIACACAAIGIVRSDWRWLCVASLAVGWGYWIRQTNGLLLLAPLAALSLMRLNKGQRKDIAQGRNQGQGKESAHLVGCFDQWPRVIDWLALSFFAAASIVLLESGWLFPSSLVRSQDIAPTTGDSFLHKTLVAAYGWVLICGWYALPWLVLFVDEARRHSRRMKPGVGRLCSLGAVVGLICAMLPLVTSSGRACLTSATGAFIQNAHYGPIFLSDMDEPGRWGTLDGVAWPLWIWQLLSVLAIISASCLAWWLLCTLAHWFVERSTGEHHPRSASALGFALMICASALAIVLLVEPHMDRYWLFLLPALSVWWLHLAAQYRWQLSRTAAAWACLWIVAHTAMSVVFTHDMLAWNNARWKYVTAQLASGVPADAIDGGRDVNAWLRMDEDPNTYARSGDTSAWWSGRASLALAVGDRPGWHAVERLPWPAWATGRTHHLLVLRRNADKALHERASIEVNSPALPEAQP